MNTAKNPFGSVFESMKKTTPLPLCDACNNILTVAGKLSACAKRGCRLRGLWIKN